MERVNHPAHYQTNKGIEAIDVMEAFTEDMKGSDAVLTATILKYLLRWKKKNGLEDLKKAKWYLERLIKNEDQRVKAEAVTLSASTSQNTNTTNYSDVY